MKCQVRRIRVYYVLDITDVTILLAEFKTTEESWRWWSDMTNQALTSEFIFIDYSVEPNNTCRLAWGQKSYDQGRIIEMGSRSSCSHVYSSYRWHDPTRHSRHRQNGGQQLDFLFSHCIVVDTVGPLVEFSRPDESEFQAPEWSGAAEARRWVVPTDIRLRNQRPSFVLYFWFKHTWIARRLNSNPQKSPLL